MLLPLLVCSPNQQPLVVVACYSISVLLLIQLFCAHIVPGRNEFAPEEDAHVVGDCVKVVYLFVFLFFSTSVAFFFH
jgi:hypothetical protein